MKAIVEVRIDTDVPVTKKLLKEHVEKVLRRDNCITRNGLVEVGLMKVAVRSVDLD